MSWDELYDTARAIVADDKGILAADESTGTIKKRFDGIGVESTEETRRAYRDLLFTTPGMEEYIGGVILYDETIRQRSDDGTPFAELLAANGRRSRNQGRHRARSRSRCGPARRSPRGSTGSASGSRSTTSSARGSRSGVR